MDGLTQTLAEIGFFQMLDQTDLDRLATIGHLSRHESETVVFREGEEGDCLYVVVSGAVEVYRDDELGHRLVIARFSRGGYFGEMALIDGAQRSASVRTLMPTTLYRMPRDQFLAFIARSPPLLSRLLNELSLRIRETTERLYRGDHDRRVRAAEVEAARQRSITQMVTGIAHELNTPLGVCMTSTSVIEELLAGDQPPDADRLREPVELLGANLRRTVALVQLFAEVAVVKPVERPMPVVLAEAAADAAILLQSRQPELRRVELRLAEGPPLVWRGDRTLLLRVLAELYANVAAHAYPPTQMPQAEVTLAEDRLDGRRAYTLSVRDFGVGIPPAAQSRVFDAFFTTARGRGHKGLGLAIVFNTVTGPLKGRVDLESAPGWGTAVTLTLPVSMA